MSPRKEPRKGPLPPAPTPPEVAAVAPPGVPERKSSSVPTKAGPHWQGRGIGAAAVARKARDAKEKAAPRDYIAEAMAAYPITQITSNINADALLTAVIVAQAFDRLGKTMLEAAAIANYKRT